MSDHQAGESRQSRSVVEPSTTATIWVGFRHRYDGQVRPIEDAIACAQTYCDEVGLCVSVTPTTFVYTNGSEPGCAVGLIDYPRFPSGAQQVEAHALTLAERLRVALDQLRVSVVLPGRTVMLSDPSVAGDPAPPRRMANPYADIDRMCGPTV